MRIIIFGGHGFIGSAVAEKYREIGYEDVFQLSRSDNVDLMDLDGTTKTEGKQVKRLKDVSNVVSLASLVNPFVKNK